MVFALLAAVGAAAPAWYGPATVDLSDQLLGNPFSPGQYDVHAIFTQGGKRFDRIAYWDAGKWHATLSADKGGTYDVQFFENGKTIGAKSKVTLNRAPDSEFVKLDGTRFKFTSGRPYIPFGHNLGWQGSPQDTYEKQLADMAKAGLNWTRIWSDAWDTKNPFVPPSRDIKLETGWFYTPATDRWDMVIRNCEKNGIKTQFVLFHHGLFSTTTDSNWGDHPWNKKNGGFLEDPADFFTDPLAKTLSKAWMRYAVARWGHSTSIMAWELFNEVQWTNAARDAKRVADVAAWHKEMGDYLRSIDPYHHLVVSSSNEALNPAVFASMDYEQPHTYPPSVFGALLGAKVPKDRPIFFGEFGGTQDMRDKEYTVVRDGFWGGLLGGHAGPGAYWYWDRAYRSKLYPEYARLAKVLARSGFTENRNAVPAPITVTGAVATDLVTRPGRGWASTDKYVYDLPADASTGALPQLSGFIQGAKGGNRAMMKEPIRLRFTAKEAGIAHFTVGTVARKGGELQFRVNGGEARGATWRAGDRDLRLDQDIPVPFPAGAVEIVIDNPGEDWVTIDSYRLPGVGVGVSAACLRSDRYALARLNWTGGFGSATKSISIPGLRDGRYELRQFDVDQGTEKVSRVAIKNGRLEDYRPFGLDEGIALFRR